MKTLICVFGFLAAINVATSTYYSGSSSLSSNSDYMQYLRQRSQLEALRRQFASICPGKEDELDDALLRLKECSDEIDEDSETACSAVKNHFMRCSKPFIELFEKCLPEQSKEIPKLVFEAVSSGFGYLCKTDGEHIFELANTCIFKSNYRTMRCERRVRTKLQQYKSKAPTKNDICEVAQSLKPCLLTHLQESCGHRITREAFMGFFDALVVPCKLPSSNRIETNSLNEVELVET